MKWSLLVGLVGFMALALDTPPSVAQEPAVTHAPSVPLLSQFDADVLECRRHMRQYCAASLQLAIHEDAKLAAEATSQLAQAMKQWEQVRSRYATAPPAEYARDARFADRLAEVADAFTTMQDHLAAKRYGKSAQACGHACGLFVAMHEENGLTYASDRLFHLRRIAKTIVASGKAGGADAVKKLLPELLNQRNRAVSASCPAGGDTQRCAEYKAALHSLSQLVDELALATANDDHDLMHQCLGKLLPAINKAYDLGL